MAVNLVNSSDTTISQTNDEISVEFSSTRSQQIDDIEDTIYEKKSINDFVVLTGLLNNGEATENYPNGFTKDNCVVISTMFSNTNNGRWGNGFIYDSSMLLNGTVPNSVKLRNDDILVETKYIGLTNNTYPTVLDITTPLAYKVILMKYDI